MLRAYCAFAISGASSETSVAAAVRCFLRSQPTSHSSHSLSFGKWTVLGHLRNAQCVGMSMWLSFVAAFVPASVEPGVPGSTDAVFHAARTGGGNLFMLLKKVVTCYTSGSLRLVFHPGIPLKRTPC